MLGLAQGSGYAATTQGRGLMPAESTPSLSALPRLSDLFLENNDALPSTANVAGGLHYSSARSVLWNAINAPLGGICDVP
jgi:hypothetical protein